MTIWVVLFFIALIVLIVLAAWAFERARCALGARRFRSTFGASKDLLIVYTDSPHWGSYIEENWLPRWGERAVILNRSRPWRPDEPAAKLWLVATGGRNHTPVAIVIPSSGKLVAIPFFAAFRDAKHGKPKALHEAEARLTAAMGDPSG